MYALYLFFFPNFRYVLLHHVMGELEGHAGAWAYVEGGMGKLSQAIADSASSMGTTILTNMVIKSLVPYSSIID